MVAGMDEVINPGLGADHADRASLEVDVEIPESAGYEEAQNRPLQELGRDRDARLTQPLTARYVPFRSQQQPAN